MQTVANHHTISPLQENKLSQVLDALNLVLGPGHDENWFQWKHISNPFGTSDGWVASDENGILGVRLMMRWSLQIGDRLIRCARPVDTITVPRARNKGVFRELTLFALDQMKNTLQPDLIFNTPNSNSRTGYEKMGWILLSPIAHALHFLVPARKAKIEYTTGAFEAWDAFVYPESRFTTQRTREVLEWRYDRRSGNDYKIGRLQNSDAPNAIIYRVARRKGIPVLILCDLLGSDKESRMLVRAAAAQERACLLLCTTGPGAMNLMSGPAVDRGQSVLAVLPGKQLPADPLSLSSWALTLGELERVI